MLSRKRKRKAGSKQTVTKKTRLAYLEPTFENAMSQSTVFNELANSLSADSLGRLSSTNKLFHALYDDHLYINKQFWQKKYYADFGKPLFNEDYHSQYIAEYLLQKAQTDGSFNNPYYQKLAKHVRGEQNKPWAQYYFAVVLLHSAEGKTNTLTPVTSPIDHALFALSFGELRAGQLIIDYLDDNFLKYDLYSIRIRSLRTMLEHFTKLPPTPDLIKLHCFTQCLIGRHGRWLDNQRCALQILMNIAKPHDIDTEAFLDLATTVFRMSGLMSDELASNLRDDPALLNCFTVFDLVKLLSSEPAIPKIIHIYLSNWVRKLQENDHPIACYHTAEEIQSNITAQLINSPGYIQSDAINTELARARNYYQKAFAGGEYRAVCEGLHYKLGGLFTLLKIKPELSLMGHDEFLAMVKKGITQDENPFCIIVLAREYIRQRNWHHDPYKIWILQLAASCSCEYGDKAYEALLRLEKYPETHLYVHCALSLVHAERGDSYRSAQAFEFVSNINPGLPDNYLKFGRQMGLCDDEHEIIFYHHKKTTYEENEVSLTIAPVIDRPSLKLIP